MKTSGAVTYEVRCPSCNVSFPPRTRSCFHCGQRIPRGTSPTPQTSRRLDPFPEGETGGADASANSMPEFLEWARTDSSEEVEAEQARPWWLRWGTNIIWVVIAILATLGQMCKGA